MIELKQLPKGIWLLIAVVAALLILVSVSSFVNWFSHQPFLIPLLPKYSLVNYAFALAILFVGILMLGSSIHQVTGKKLRQFKLLPLIVGAAIIIFTLFLWNAMRETRNKNLRAMVTFQAIHVKQEISARIEFEMYAIRSMAKRWEVRGGTPELEWRTDAKTFMDYYPSFQALQWVDDDFEVRWAVPEEFPEGINSHISINRRDVLFDSRHKNIVGITKIVDLDDNAHEFYIYTTLYTHGIFSGFLVGVVDPELLFNNLLSNEVEAGYAVSISQSGDVVFHDGDIEPVLQKQWGKVASFRLQDVNWQIKLMPTQALLDQQGEHMPTFVLLAGVTVALLLMIAIFLSQLSFKHARMVFVAHENLRKETIDRKRTEQIKQRLEKALQQSQKLEAIGTLAGGVAHDFNNILYAIMGYVEMARQDLPEDTLVYDNLGKVIKAGQRGKKLVSSILSFSRQEAHQFEKMNLVEIVDVCFDLLKPIVPANVQLDREIKVDEAIVYGSHTDIEQVLINIVNNAVDAIQEYGNITVHLSASHADQEPLKSMPDKIADVYFCIGIKDDGEGMSDETLQRLFEPFYTTKEVGSGTGLGLSMAHGIIKNHNGIILANSLLGKGSTFYIYLPQYSGEQ